jgi:hypothetical protein
MSYVIEQQEWQSLPEYAQRDVYNYFLHIKQRCESKSYIERNKSETIAFSNHSASNIEEWASDKEDNERESNS